MTSIVLGQSLSKNHTEALPAERGVQFLGLGATGGGCPLHEDNRGFYMVFIWLSGKPVNHEMHKNIKMHKHVQENIGL